MSSFKRIRKYLIPTLLVVILAISILAAYASYSSGTQAKANPDVYVGVAFGGNTTEEAKVLIDRVKSYTNLFILDSGRNAISENQSAVEEICDYAVSQGLSVIINLGVRDALQANNSWFWRQPLNVTEQFGHSDGAANSWVYTTMTSQEGYNWTGTGQPGLGLTGRNTYKVIPVLAMTSTRSI